MLESRTQKRSKRVSPKHLAFEGDAMDLAELWGVATGCEDSVGRQKKAQSLEVEHACHGMKSNLVR
jgi:hypothetical protein